MPVLKDRDKRNEIRRALYASFDKEGVSLPETVRALRKLMAMSQDQFAEFIGLSLSALRRIEQQNGNVTLETINKILLKFSLVLVVKRASKNSLDLS